MGDQRGGLRRLAEAEGAMIGGAGRHEAFLAGLDAATRASVMAVASQRCFAAGTPIFHQGDPPSHMQLICTGLVKVIQIGPAGSQTTLHILGPGDLIGCVAVIKRLPFPATAIAIQGTSVLSWTAPQIRELMSQHPQVAANLLRDLGTRVEEMAARVVDLLHNNVEQRIASVLLRLADLAGEPCEAGTRLIAPVTRNEVAELSGATYFTVSRTLGQWQRQGWVSTGREQILIVAPDQLSQIAGPPSFGG